MSETLEDQLSLVKRRVWSVISSYLPKRGPERHYQAVSEYPRRQGKYLRPALCLFTNALYGGQTRAALLTAAAVQTSEDWLLIHDDFQDHATTRRGKASLNRLFGDEIAVNAGNSLHILMWRMLTDNLRVLGEKQGFLALQKMSEVLLTTLEGQYLEMAWVRDGRFRINESEYLEMVKRKTAFYTAVGPAQLGAICAGKIDSVIMRNITAWGMPFGCAFQLLDDLSDIAKQKFTASAKIGGDDIDEGKRTLILAHCLKHSSGPIRRLIEKIYRTAPGKKTLADKAFVLKAFEKSGSIAYVKTLAEKFARQAERVFLRSTRHLSDNQARRHILELIRLAAGWSIK